MESIFGSIFSICGNKSDAFDISPPVTSPSMVSPGCIYSCLSLGDMSCSLTFPSMSLTISAFVPWASRRRLSTVAVATTLSCRVKSNKISSITPTLTPFIYIGLDADKPVTSSSITW